MKTNPNDTAYPSAAISNYEETNAVGGLTKREHFAALAIQGILSNSGSWREHFAALAMQGILSNSGGWAGREALEREVRIAVKYADALIEELNKKV